MEIIPPSHSSVTRTNLRLYRIWRGMHNRCKNPNVAAYKHYGRRGIYVCLEWTGKSGFDSFQSWSHDHGYSDDLSIERIDINGNYEPDNCCWIPFNQQSSNTRANHRVTIFGETKILKNWSRDERCKVSYKTLHYRILNGWNPERALTENLNDKKPPTLTGINNKNAKLTDDDVIEIRLLCTQCKIEKQEIAHRFGITPQAVWQIYTRRTWKHIP